LSSIRVDPGRRALSASGDPAALHSGRWSKTYPGNRQEHIHEVRISDISQTTY